MLGAIRIIAVRSGWWKKTSAVVDVASVATGPTAALFRYGVYLERSGCWTQGLLSTGIDFG